MKLYILGSLRNDDHDSIDIAAVNAKAPYKRLLDSKASTTIK